MWFAEKYGWTPDVVDSLPLSISSYYMPIAGAIREEESRREEEAIKRAERKRAL